MIHIFKNSIAVTFVILIVFTSDDAYSQPNQASFSAGKQLQRLMFTTPAYRQEALCLVVERANRIAQELCLHEELPITKSNVLEAYIPPPLTAQDMKVIGNITTSNYFYAPYAGRLFSVVQTHLEEGYQQLKKEYLWPMKMMDTNAAYQLATQFLGNVSIDVKALNEDCHRSIRAFTPEGRHGSHFVPVYWVSWSKRDTPVASVELCLPTKTVRQIHVLDPKYILQKPLTIPNLDYLLSQTNGSTMTSIPMNYPGQSENGPERVHGVELFNPQEDKIPERLPINQKNAASVLPHRQQFASRADGAGVAANAHATPPWATRPFSASPTVFQGASYRANVLPGLLREANEIASELHLPEHLPISEKNFVGASLSSPIVVLREKSIGSIETSNYIYRFAVDDKFSSLERTHWGQEDNRLESQYVWPINQIDTNAAFQLATHFLSAASMDAAALNRDCNVHIQAAMPAHNDGKHFVPLYRVSWIKRGDQEGGKVASIELFLPTKTLEAMSVNESKYILRKPVPINDREFSALQRYMPGRPVMREKGKLPGPAFLQANHNN